MKHEIKNTLLIAIYIVCIYGCQLKMFTYIKNNSFKPLPDSEQVVLVYLHQPEPVGCAYIGYITSGTSYFTGGAGYTYFISNAKDTARKAGANVVVIKELNTSGAYGIKANMLHSVNPHAILLKARAYSDSLSQSKIPPGAQYAVVHVYKPTNGKDFYLHVDKKMVEQTTYGHPCNIKLYKEGRTEIWARTDVRSSVFLNVEFGKEYYIRCDITQGQSFPYITEPALTPVGIQQAYDEYECYYAKPATRPVIRVDSL